jgi:quinohemoprotein ethanol dehydrogenase
MEMAAKTWKGEWWKYGGGATVWNAMAYDPEFNRIYIGTGNGAPWNQKIRSPGGGDNLFVCSIIALDADTGNYVWHYQTNPGETWDFNSDMDIELTRLKIDGMERPVILHAPKNGFFYVIDRETGKLISARNYVPVNWAKGIDPKTGRPIENPEARFPGGKAAIVYPSPFGAHNIEAMSFSPKAGLVFIPAMDQGRVYIDPPQLKGWAFPQGQRIANGIGAPPPNLAPRKPTSFLLAWNPLTQREAWRVPLEGPRGSGGTAATAGNLLFAGRATGQFTALAADSGKQLWSFDAGAAVMAQPITYLAGGKQYVAVIAGARFASAQGFAREWNYANQTWRVLTFAIGGKDKLPLSPQDVAPITGDAGFRVDVAKAKQGQAIYADRCAICHGANLLSGGTAPDLLRSATPIDADAFASVLVDGALVSRGMPGFQDLSTADDEALRHYIRQRAREQSAAVPAKLNRSQDEGQ